MNKKLPEVQFPEEFLALPAEKVVEILINNPEKITEIFGKNIGIFFQAKLLDKSMRPVISELLLRLVVFSQQCHDLKKELAENQKNLKDYLSNRFISP